MSGRLDEPQRLQPRPPLRSLLWRALAPLDSFTRSQFSRPLVAVEAAATLSTSLTPLGQVTAKTACF